MNQGATPQPSHEQLLLLALPFALELHALVELRPDTQRSHTLDELAIRNLRPLYSRLLAHRQQVAQPLLFGGYCRKAVFLALFAQQLHGVLGPLEDVDLRV